MLVLVSYRDARFGDLKVQPFLVIEPVILVLGLGVINGIDGERYAGTISGT